MKVTRREFINYCTLSATALGLTSTLGSLENALSNSSGPPVIWLKGASCTGCTVSLANRISGSAPVDVGDLLINTIDLVYHSVLMGAAGDSAVKTLKNAASGPFILAVEGGIPTQYNGAACTIYNDNGSDVTALSAIRTLAPKAAYVLSIGTCAAFGGIPGAIPNPTGIQDVMTAGRKPTINIPGCPLDSYRRPTALFGSTVHSRCPRREHSLATSLSQTGLCMNNLGCKGPQTYADCPSRKWNNGVNWCVGADSLCQGCTQKGFPDRFSPLFSTMGALPREHERVSSPRPTCMTCHNGRIED
jgi:hydrogenase small subunit